MYTNQTFTYTAGKKLKNYKLKLHQVISDKAFYATTMRVFHRGRRNGFKVAGSCRPLEYLVLEIEIWTFNRCT